MVAAALIERVRSPLAAKLIRYAGGSVVATVCSELTLLLAYGVAHVAPAWASVLAWLAGAVPNYWLNRRWTWQRTGRVDVRRELAPYVAVIGVTLLLAALTTKGVDAWLRHVGVDADLRVVLVAASFFGVYVVMFALRFVLLDRLFSRVS